MYELSNDAQGREQPRDEERLDRVQIRRDKRVAIVRLTDVDWISAARNYVCLHSGGQVFKSRMTMMDFIVQASPEEFVRIHRSAIVNMRSVDLLVAGKQGRLRLRLRSGEYLSVSRSYRDSVVRTLKIGKTE